MNIRVVEGTITRSELIALGDAVHGELIKAVADIERQVLAFGGYMHADAERVLLEQGSQQSSLWGFNLLLNQPRTSCIQFTSLINIRPADRNRSIEIERSDVRHCITQLVDEKVQWNG